MRSLLFRLIRAKTCAFIIERTEDGSEIECGANIEGPPNQRYCSVHKQAHRAAVSKIQSRRKWARRKAGV